jgi:AcrR family transcriptional regulator
MAVKRSAKQSAIATTAQSAAPPAAPPARRGSSVDGAPPRTQAQRRERTRAALISAARAMFAELGYASASREDIVERAGVTRGAMYHHFSSKEALFQAVFEVVEGELCEAIAKSAMASKDPIEQLRLGARAFLDAAATSEVRRIVLLDAPAVLPVEVRRRLSEQYGLGMVREALRHADAAGRLAVGPVDALALVVMAVLHEAATAIADGDDPGAMHSVIDGMIGAITKP